MATRTITVHDKCTAEDCGKTLHTIADGERGVCGMCWYKAMSTDTKKAMNRLIATAFNGATESEKKAAVTDALKKLDRDAKLKKTVLKK